MLNLNGKVMLITGAGRGIGGTTAILVARAGATVAVNYNRAKTEGMGAAEVRD